MTVSLTSPVTGAPQTGLTSPTYTLTADTPPNAHSRQWAVTAIGGTQAGVSTHTASSPFTVTAIRPADYRGLGKLNPQTGLYGSVPRNITTVLVRKGVTPAANMAAVPMLIRVEMSTPAGADTFDAANIRAALSLAFGAIAQQSAGIGDTVVVGVL